MSDSGPDGTGRPAAPAWEGRHLGPREPGLACWPGFWRRLRTVTSVSEDGLPAVICRDDGMVVREASSPWLQGSDAVTRMAGGEDAPCRCTGRGVMAGTPHREFSSGGITWAAGLGLLRAAGQGRQHGTAGRHGRQPAGGSPLPRARGRRRACQEGQGTMWKKAELEKEITFEEFEEYLACMHAWLSKKPRTLRGWLYSVIQWAEGNH